jgi:hypothetical protein
VSLTLRDLIQAAIEAGLTVREIIAEPDGTQRLLTERKEIAPMLDPLSEARARRAGKGQRNVDRDKAAG